MCWSVFPFATSPHSRTPNMGTTFQHILYSWSRFSYADMIALEDFNDNIQTSRTENEKYSFVNTKGL